MSFINCGNSHVNIPVCITITLNRSFPCGKEASLTFHLQGHFKSEIKYCVTLIVTPKLLRQETHWLFSSRGWETASHDNKRRENQHLSLKATHKEKGGACGSRAVTTDGDVLWVTAALPPRRPQLPEGAAVPSLDGEFSLEGELPGRHGGEAQRCDSSFSSEFLRNGEQLQCLMMTLKRLQNPNCPLHGEKSSGHFLVLPRVFPYCSYISPLSYSGEKARGLSH